MESSLGRLLNSIQMDVMEDALSASSCHIMAGMVKMIPMPLVN
jgi:hypothetical protein